MNTTRRTERSRSQRGYALILAMVALVALTLFGVTAISVAQLDLKITNNLRHHRQVAYGALTGLDHGRDLFTDNQVDPSADIETAADLPGDCITGWISATGANAVAAPLLLDANGFPLATYAVDFCVASCGLPPTGTSLGESVIGYTVDIVSTGTTTIGSNATQTQGAFVIGTLEPATCDGDKS
ncbi:MAG: hypothetical protein KDA24_09955 [Deltaproteobacteria bacterium]|nr:hypothetical protein [Deltaproteobacteria bacterium]